MAKDTFEKAVGQYDTGSREGRHVYEKRFLLTLLAISMFSSVSMAIALVQLTPLKEVETVFLTFTPLGQHVVAVQPAGAPVAATNVYAQGLAQDYIRLRLAIIPDRVLMEQRWKTLLEYTHKDLLGSLTGVGEVVAEAIRQRIYRKVEINEITRAGGGSFRAMVTILDENAQGQALRDPIVLRLVLRVSFEPKELVPTDLLNKSVDLINAHGFTVWAYSQEEVNK